MGLRATLVKRHILHGTPGPSGRVFPVPGNLAVGLCPRSLVQRLEAAVCRGHRLVGGRHRGRRTIVIASTRNAPLDSGYESFQNATANPSTVRSLFELSGENCWHNNRGESFSWHVVLKSYDLILGLKVFMKLHLSRNLTYTRVQKSTYNLVFST